MAALMGMTLLVLLVQDIPLSSYLRTVETDRIITSLERDAFVLAGRAEQALESGAAADVTQLAKISMAYRSAGGARVVIVNTAGLAIVTSDDDQSSVGASYSSRPEITDALTGVVNSGQRYSQTLKIELLYVTVPVLSSDTVRGAVRLTYPASVVTEAVNGQLGVLGLVALSAVLLSGIVGFAFSTSVTSRLKRLKEATEALSEGDLQTRADEKSGAPELKSLSRSFNLMAERLDSLIKQQAAFAADASHQLRTPLTAIRLRLERARELLATDPAAAAERLAAAEVEMDRLGNIIEGLLLLSRGEAAATPLQVVDLAEIAKARVAQWQALGQELNVGIAYLGPSVARVSAVREAPEQIIDNFVDNALSVSKSGDSLVVAVVVTGARTALHVLDQGPGLTENERDRAFDRFWRANSEKEGSGLGLAIVAQLATASRAHVKLSARNQQAGLDASVEFETIG
jgi:signal transduction histidine kinase